MTNQEFIDWAERFFVDVTWTPALRKKLLYMINNLDSKTYVVEKPETIIKREIIYITKEDPRPKERPDLEEIAIDVCQKHRLSIKDLQSRSRKTHLVHARVDFCKLGREVYGYTLNELGGFLGRDHTTVIHYLTTWKHPVPDISKFGYDRPGIDGGNLEGDSGVEADPGGEGILPEVGPRSVGTLNESEVQRAV